MILEPDLPEFGPYLMTVFSGRFLKMILVQVMQIPYSDLQDIATLYKSRPASFTINVSGS